MSYFVKLSELIEKMRCSLIENFNEYYLITAEILQINLNASGHCYLELIEKEEKTGTITAKIKAIIWSSKYKLVAYSFLETTGQNLSIGMKILAKVEVNFHSVFGISLVIQDIDATYTLGEYELMRQKVIDQLTQDGVMNMNKELIFPVVPTRFAIISSLSAAGLGDFLDHLESNPHNYKYTFKVFDSVMQGDDTEKSLINALTQVFNSINSFDFVVIIRGGGSKHDLSAFDRYQVCSHIAQFPLPILTGIGHQRDTSIADLVAFKSLKTPTAVADFIIQKTFDFDMLISEKIDIISHLSKKIIDENIVLLNHKKMFFLNSTKTCLNFFQGNIDSYKRNFLLKTKSLIINKLSQFNIKKNLFQFSVKQFIQNKISYVKNIQLIFKNTFHKNLNNTENLLKEKLQIVELINPIKILKMGYSITYKDKKIVKYVKQLNSGDRVKIIFQDGNNNATID